MAELPRITLQGGQLMGNSIQLGKRMSYKTVRFIEIALSSAIAICCFFILSISNGYCGVNVKAGFNVPLPPPFVLHAPPPVVILPGAEYVYFAPGLKIDIFFYRGYWYQPFNQRWYRSSSYNGPWAFVHPNNVPRPLYSVPPDYRRVPPVHQHIPYGQLKKNWGSWERDRHWDRHDGPPHDRGKPEPWEKHRDRDRDWDRRGPGGHDRGYEPR
jgi:hypothetical protein